MADIALYGESGVTREILRTFFARPDVVAASLPQLPAIGMRPRTLAGGERHETFTVWVRKVQSSASHQEPMVGMPG